MVSITSAEYLFVVTHRGSHHELHSVESYKATFSHAQAMVNQTSSNTANAPITVLPVEILTHIFQLALADQPCPFQTEYHWNDEDNPVQLPKYPDTIAQVCSRWRRIAVACPSLWSHIDIVLSCPLSIGFHDRAKVHVTRAQPLPIDIYIIDPGIYREAKKSNNNSSFELDFPGAGPPDERKVWNELMRKNNPENFEFISPEVMPRIRTLGLRVHYQCHAIHSRALEHCLTNCLPGGLRELNINVPYGRYFTPIFLQPEAYSGPHGRNRTWPWLALSERQLEYAWASVVTLHLKGVYPFWNSAAYHGLTELRLPEGHRISDSELVRFLGSSPQLRTICCNFRIRETYHNNTVFSPIALKELEVIDLMNMSDSSVETFLRWLNPGSKPLQLSLCCNPISVVLKDFVSRSNVREIRVRPPLWEDKILPLAWFYLPLQLRILGVDGWGVNPVDDWGPSPMTPQHDQPVETQSPLDLDALYMLSCYFEDFSSFEEFVKKCAPQRLILWDCEISHSNTKSRIDLPLLRSAAGGNFSQLCPSVECLTSSDSKPLSDWERYPPM
ncbi:F-box-like [Rhizoctonia solani]|uniref:F-box-like n=1 Tax=Rhizoctonia solani TaxID=456999 RepID=A0A8H7M516_9AGAM|nr:F-box-like [Rhizoctonia solani]